MTREAVIVSTARTGLAKSGRGGFNMTHGAAIAGHAVKHSIERANLDPAEIDDVIWDAELLKVQQAKMLDDWLRFGQGVL